VDVIVHESLESLSSSEVEMLYEYAASSSTAVPPVLVMLGASLVLVTVMSNVWVPVAPAASATVMVTLWTPTSPSSGMPARAAVLAPAVCVSVSQDTLVDVIVHESLESLSSSEVVMLYEYTASSSTAVPPVLVMLGASLVLATTMVNVSVAEAVPSLAVMTTLLSPTLALSGVPASTPVEAVKVAQDGTWCRSG